MHLSGTVTQGAKHYAPNKKKVPKVSERLIHK